MKTLGESAPRHRSYHRVIVVCGAIGGLFGLIGGIIGAIAMYRFHAAAQHANDAYIAFLSPILTAAAGMLAGASWACAFAPTSFLNGPLGTKWLKLIGTRNLVVSRVIALVVGIVGTGFCIAIMILRDANP